MALLMSATMLNMKTTLMLSFGLLPLAVSFPPGKGRERGHGSSILAPTYPDPSSGGIRCRHMLERAIYCHGFCDLLSNVLKGPLKKDGRPVLDPLISDRALRIAYRETACLVLELSKPQFSRIGALIQQGKEFVVGRRPLTFNIMS